MYGYRLEYSPIHLHYDEIFFGLQGHAIQTTGRDLNGLRLPVYFQLDSTANWYQPIAVYWTALVLSVAPLSDAAIRFPTVLVGTLNVVLTFYLARALLQSLAWATVAAVLLMLTPAHFIHSRVAMDYVYPLPFLLGWALWMVRFLDSRATRDVLIACSCLGLAFFSYIAGTALAPMYLLFTAALLASLNACRLVQAAIGAFALPIIAALGFIALYPDVVPHLMDKYGLIDSSAAGSSLDPLQRLRSSLTGYAVSDFMNRYWSFYSPGYLFVTGGSNLTNSTRAAGVFLPPLALLLLVGVVRSASEWRRRGAILLFGFCTAALPAALLPDYYAVDREMAKVPFAVVIATMGAAWLWRTPLARPVGAIVKVAAAVAALVALGYGTVTLAARGELSGSTPLLLVAAVAVFALGVAIERRRDWSPVVAISLVLVPFMFVPFHADYFDGYRLRASGWFGGNIRGALEDVIAREATAPEIHINTDIPYIRSYWKFYQAVYQREDLAEKTRFFDGRTIDLGTIRPGSLVLAAGDDPVTKGLAVQGELTPLSAIKDRADESDPVQFVVYRR